MSQAYPYTRLNAYQYQFVSHGNERIEKVAIFTSPPEASYFAFSFGDLLKDGIIDNYVNSNNGDMHRILATLIEILRDFINEHPSAKIFFTGSTEDFSKEFIITELTKERNGIREVLFSPSSQALPLGFFITKK